MLHAIVGHTYTKYTHKMHKYTDAQIHTNIQGKYTQNKNATGIQVLIKLSLSLLVKN